MTQEGVLTQIKEEHEKNKNTEKRIRHWLFGIIMTFGIASIALFGKVMVMDNIITTVYERQMQIKRSYVSQESFMLFNRTYELQLQETQAVIKGDERRVEEIQEKYRELRSMLVESPRYRTGGGSQK